MWGGDWQQDAAIARIFYFFEKHWEERMKFSRRTQCQLERWAARYGYKEQPMEILDYAKKGYHGGRYICANPQNSDTVEFRMFRGTLKTSTFLATLELVDRICGVAINLSDEKLRSLDHIFIRNYRRLLPGTGVVSEGTAALCQLDY